MDVFVRIKEVYIVTVIKYFVNYGSCGFSDDFKFGIDT